MKFKIHKIVFPELIIRVDNNLYKIQEENLPLELEVKLDIGNTKIESSMYQLHISCNVADKDKNVEVNVTGIGVFELVDIIEDKVEYFMGVNCPAALYPYIREKVTLLTVSAGIQPIYLDSYNFIGMYNDVINNNAK